MVDRYDAHQPNRFMMPQYARPRPDQSPDSDDDAAIYAISANESRYVPRTRRISRRDACNRDRTGAGGARVFININQEARRPRILDPPLQRPEHRIVTIQHLPWVGHQVGNTRVSVGMEYQIPYDLLVSTLPNTREAIQGDMLDMETFFTPEMLDVNPRQYVYDACRYIFEFIERYNRTGDLAFLYEACQQIAMSEQPGPLIQEWGKCALSICIVLHRCGMGCSEFLLGRFLRFMTLIMPRVEQEIGAEQAATLFVQLLAVFQTRGAETWPQMCVIWDSMDIGVKDMVLEYTYRRGRGDWRDYLWLLEIDGH